jgi:hypothetical protein
MLATRLSVTNESMGFLKKIIQFQLPSIFYLPISGRISWATIYLTYLTEFLARDAHFLESSLSNFDRHSHHQVVPSTKINNVKIFISESHPY